MGIQNGMNTFHAAFNGNLEIQKPDSSLVGRVHLTQPPHSSHPMLENDNPTTPPMSHTSMHKRGEFVSYERKALVMKSMLPGMLRAALSLPAATLPELRGRSLVESYGFSEISSLFGLASLSGP